MNQTTVKITPSTHMRGLLFDHASAGITHEDAVHRTVRWLEAVIALGLPRGVLPIHEATISLRVEGSIDVEDSVDVEGLHRLLNSRRCCCGGLEPSLSAMFTGVI